MRSLLPVLLKAYPWAFRQEFGAGMLEIMLADYTRARSTGRSAALFVLLATAFDALWAGLKERLNPTWMATRQRKDRRQKMKNTFEAWGRDFVHAARNLLRAPGFTVVTVATLALAIGANTAIFSVVNGVLIDPLPFPEADRLVALRGTAPGTDLPEEFGLGSEFFVEYSENATALEDLALVQTAQTTVRGEGHVERLFISAVSPSLFTTLGVEPVIGRLPTNEEDEGTVIVLSHWLWMAWAGGDPAVLGRAYEVSGGLRTVIGVMGPDFRYPTERTSLWVNDLVTEPVQAGGFGLDLVGRLAPGADHESLTTELASLARRLPDRFGGSVAYARIIERFRPVVRSLVEQRIGNVQGPLWMLMGTVGIVLLIACANVANLLIVRAESRQRDTAVRRALGAGRGRLIGSQLAEAVLLAAVGGAGGVVLAWIGVPLLVRAAPENIPGLSNIRLDTTALLFTAGVAMLAALVSGSCRRSDSRSRTSSAVCAARVESRAGATS